MKQASWLIHCPRKLVNSLKTSFLCNLQWCVCAHQGQEPACGMLQVCHMWNISQECWLLQHKQQTVL